MQIILNIQGRVSGLTQTHQSSRSQAARLCVNMLTSPKTTRSELYWPGSPQLEGGKAAHLCS